MESINSDFLQAVQADKHLPSIKFHQPNDERNPNQPFVNDSAFSFMPQVSGMMSNFDMAMNNFASFKDIISTAQNGISAMRTEGESIRSLVKQAQEEGITPEVLDKIQQEVDSRVAEINRIKNTTNFNGIYPFNGNFSLDVPDIQSLLGKSDKEEAANEISEMLASFDIDMSIEGNGFSIGGSAKIEIGMTEDGALQINVDASMDYDLSGLVKDGVNSDNAFDLINNFINMLGVQQGDLGNASNFLDAIIEQIFEAMNGDSKALPDGLSVSDDSTSVKGHVVQQASITLDGAANQMPNIAINIL